MYRIHGCLSSLKELHPRGLIVKLQLDVVLKEVDRLLPVAVALNPLPHCGDLVDDLLLGLGLVCSLGQGGPCAVQLALERILIGLLKRLRKGGETQAA